MKPPHSPRGGRMITGLLACLCSSSSAFAADIPTGTLNVDRALIQVGSKSNLEWSIKYPVGITALRSTETLTMRVRVLGSSFQSYKNNSGGGNNLDGVDADNNKSGTTDPSGTYDDEKKLGKGTPLPVEVMWSLNHSSWARLFYGTTSDVNPSTIVANTIVKPSDVVSFGARGYRDGAWLPLYNTATPSSNVVVLENGAALPPTVQQSYIQNILKPYIAANNTVRIGTRDLIILMELGQTNPIYADFNLQDLILLVTFE
jgi:hypothetical protein